MQLLGVGISSDIFRWTNEPVLLASPSWLSFKRNCMNNRKFNSLLSLSLGSPGFIRGYVLTPAVLFIFQMLDSNLWCTRRSQMWQLTGWKRKEMSTRRSFRWYSRLCQMFSLSLLQLNWEFFWKCKLLRYTASLMLFGVLYVSSFPHLPFSQ